MTTVSDRRRINGPPGGTAPPIFAETLAGAAALQQLRPVRTRAPNELRKIYLKTGITPTASGSAYLELPPPNPQDSTTSTSTSTSEPAPTLFLPPTPSLKITCAVHGPRPLPRSSPYSPSLLLSTSVKFAPFATRRRRGHVRDASERDLAQHLENALRGVVLGERWPKSGVDVVVTVLEGEEAGWWGDEAGGAGAQDWGLMGVLAGCVTVSCAAVVDAGIDCVDLVVGGFAAVLRGPEPAGRLAADSRKGGRKDEDLGADEVTVRIVLDPNPTEHADIAAACVVAYLSNRDEITELWLKGDVGDATETLIDKSVEAALAARTVLVDAVKEGMQEKLGEQTDNPKPAKDVDMSG